MKNIIWLIIFTGISAYGSAQDTAKDTTAKKDTTIILKLGTIVKTVVKDTVPKKEAQKDTLLEKTFEKKVYGVHQFVHETFLFVEAPAKWHKTDWLRLGLTVAATAAIMPFDQKISNVTLSHQRNYYIVPVDIGRIYGEWYFFGTVTAAFIGYGIFTHNREAEKIDIELLQAGIYSEIITQLIKVPVGRARPYEGMGAFSFHPFRFFDANFESMPSGHSAFAFALSSITFRHTNSIWLKILTFVPAGLTIFSRVYQNDHWASDEFLGAAIGYATGNWVVTLHEGKRHKINIKVTN